MGYWGDYYDYDMGYWGDYYGDYDNDYWGDYYGDWDYYWDNYYGGYYGGCYDDYSWSDGYYYDSILDEFPEGGSVWEMIDFAMYYFEKELTCEYYGDYEYWC
jgi:hypothetical protein